MSIRTLSSDEPFPGVILAIVEVTSPGEDRRIVYEVSCEACDSFDPGLSYNEAQDELKEHDHHHHIEKGQE